MPSSSASIVNFEHVAAGLVRALLETKKWAFHIVTPNKPMLFTKVMRIANEAGVQIPHKENI